MRALQAIILAAGEGIRMKSSVVKVLHPICGRPMMSYALDLAAAAGIKQPIVVIGQGAEEVRKGLPREAKVVIQAKPQGTGDAVLAAKRALGGLGGDLLVLYADTPLLRRTTIQRLIEQHYKTGASCTLLSTHLADPSGYGRIVRDTNGAITEIVEESDANAPQRAIREINVGPACFKTQALFDALAAVRPSQVKKEWYLTAAVSGIAHQEGAKIQTVRLEDASEALGINSRFDLARSMAIIRQRLIESHLANGVTVVDPQTTFIDHGVSIGQDTVIQPCTVIESRVVIGRRCVIGPFARLRSGVALADDVRVGNFVELVRSKVGTRVRIQHVTYLGDTTVGEEVNIGAGTMTANFDGTQKLPTIIEKGAFIGCDTVLIAPVKVGEKAVTGAGSVIPKGHDVPPRRVVVGVPARLLEQTEDGKAAPARVGKGPAPGRPTKRPGRVAVPSRRVSPKRAARSHQKAKRSSVRSKVRPRMRLARHRVRARAKARRR